jgi:hypothetical protein
LNFTNDMWFGQQLGNVHVQDYQLGDNLPFGSLDAWVTNQIAAAGAIIMIVSKDYIQKELTLKEWRQGLSEINRRRLIFVPVMIDASSKAWWEEQKQLGNLRGLGHDYAYSDFTENGKPLAIVTTYGPVERVTRKISELAWLIRSHLEKEVPKPAAPVSGTPGQSAASIPGMDWWEGLARELIALLRSQPPAVSEFMRRTYRRTLEALDDPPDVPGEDVADMISQLADKPDFGREPLLIHFATSLAEELRAVGRQVPYGPDLAMRLETWMRKAGADPVTEARATPAIAKSNDFVFGVLSIQTDWISSKGAFATNCWLVYDNMTFATWDGEPKGKDGLKKWVAETILLLSKEECVRGRELVLQFVLDERMLNEEIDRWRVSYSPDNQDTIGQVYATVLRSRWRVSGPDSSLYRERWSRRSRLASTHGQGLLPWHWVACPDDSDDLPSRLADRGGAGTTMPTEAVGIGFGFAPVGVSKAKTGALRQALRAGIPVIIWPRRPPPADLTVVEKELNCLFTGSFADLPLRVQKRRQKASRAKSDDIGHHLSVLWDDGEHCLDRWLTTALTDEGLVVEG